LQNVTDFSEQPVFAAPVPQPALPQQQQQEEEEEDIQLELATASFDFLSATQLLQQPFNVVENETVIDLLSRTAQIYTNADTDMDDHRLVQFLQVTSSALYYAELQHLPYQNRTIISRQLIGAGAVTLNSHRKIRNIGHKVWLMLCRFGLGALAFCAAKSANYLRKISADQFMVYVQLLDRDLPDQTKERARNATFPNIPSLAHLFDRLQNLLPPPSRPVQ
jgi:hypothetical protein